VAQKLFFFGHSTTETATMQLNDQVIRVLVVDDEQPSRQRVVRLLMKSPVRTEITEAEGGSTGARRAPQRELQPYVFRRSDARDERSGGPAQTIPEQLPTTIFVTAYEEHALDNWQLFQKPRSSAASDNMAADCNSSQ